MKRDNPMAKRQQHERRTLHDQEAWQDRRGLIVFGSAFGSIGTAGREDCGKAIPTSAGSYRWPSFCV